MGSGASGVMSPEEKVQALPVSLLDFLSNSLILTQICPYLNISSLLALAATSKSFASLLYDSSESFRHLDLSSLRGGLSKRDHVGRDMTPNFGNPPEDHYFMALRSVFNSLERRNVVKNVTTLILDEFSVPCALLSEMLCKDSYNIRLLSLRGCDHVSDSGLMQILSYIIRPARPKGHPKLKGVYYFGVTDRTRDTLVSMQNVVVRGPTMEGVTSSLGSQLGARLFGFSSSDRTTRNRTSSEDWYTSSGQVLSITSEADWAHTLQSCSGIIAFDAVLCRNYRKAHPRPKIATISLGPEGCQKCHSSPEGPAFAGESPIEQLPLLAPVPLHSSLVKTAQKPTLGDVFTPPFYARCRDCLENRWCERCNAWWCEDCYTVPTQTYGSGQAQAGAETSGKDSIKVHLGLCVERCLMEEMYHGSGEGGMWG